jgi:hypothetical protein
VHVGGSHVHVARGRDFHRDRGGWGGGSWGYDGAYAASCYPYGGVYPACNYPY